MTNDIVEFDIFATNEAPEPTPLLTALVIRANGIPRMAYVHDHYKAFQLAVGGLVTGIYPDAAGRTLFGRWTGYVNDDGFELELPVNPAATMFAREIGWNAEIGTHLHGDVLFVGAEGDRDVDVPEAVVEHVNDFYTSRGLWTKS